MTLYVTYKPHFKSISMINVSTMQLLSCIYTPLYKISFTTFHSGSLTFWAFVQLYNTEN